MIGPGFAPSAGRFRADSEMGMLDVSANALAVLVLATMLIISAAAPPAVRGEVARDDIPGLFYPSPLAGALSPLSRYVVVSSAGATVLNLDPFAEAFAGNETQAVTSQGEGTLVVDRKRYRDLNDYRVRIIPDWDALEAQAAPLDPDGIALEASVARGAFADDRIATTYFVRSDAVAEFAPLYWELRNAQAPMRWVTVPPSTALNFTRRVENFERRARQWQ